MGVGPDTRIPTRPSVVGPGPVWCRGSRPGVVSWVPTRSGVVRQKRTLRTGGVTTGSWNRVPRHQESNGGDKEDGITPPIMGSLTSNLDEHPVLCDEVSPEVLGATVGPHSGVTGSSVGHRRTFLRSSVDG